jgi:hypothetical protein
VTKPLRPWLLNHQIGVEARRIAHAATKTCRYQSDGGTDRDDEHTRNCNWLKHEIEALAKHVKLASMQEPAERTPPPEADNMNVEDQHK